MPKRPSGPPFPDSPGAWIACFRHRVRENGKPLSPEELGRRIGRSGATVRRWEANSFSPEERDIARLAAVCNLTSIQSAFLSAACARVRAISGPDGRAFRAYMREVLESTSYPALVQDGLFYARGWNSYINALGHGAAQTLERSPHPVALMLRARAELFGTGTKYERVIEDGLRIFWMATAIHSHRPEYAELLGQLRCEPGFEEKWMELALGQDTAPKEPITFAYSVGSEGARFRVYTRTITFPPTYYLNEYMPANEVAEQRLDQFRQAFGPEAHFKRELHWVKSPGLHC